MGLFNWISKGVRVEKRKPKTRSDCAEIDLQQLAQPDGAGAQNGSDFLAQTLGGGGNNAQPSAASILFENTERQGISAYQQYNYDPNSNFTGAYGAGSNFGANGYGASSAALGASAYNNRNILVVTPSSNAEVTEVVTNLRNGDACIVCLEGLEITDAQRRLDFLSGVICAMNGSIKRLNANTYILTPTGIGVRKQSQ